jgi:hypothetical protein
MRYIAKTLPPESFTVWHKKHRNLIDKQLKKVNLETLLIDAVWNGFRKPEKDTFRSALLAEQGMLCAYCGSLLKDNSTVRLDHVMPKKVKPERVFDYRNLVAACSGGAYILHTIQVGETLETIATYYATDVPYIQRLNPDMFLEAGKVLEIRIGETIPKTKIAVKVNFPHCDVKKKDNVHPIIPTQQDCATYFGYAPDGIIYPTDPNNQEAKETIEILGLNDNPFLIEKRQRIFATLEPIKKAISNPNLPLFQKLKFIQEMKDRLKQLESMSASLEEMIFVKTFLYKSLLLNAK